jgi:hypothetical protein
VSAAMTLGYHGVAVDPPALNDWLVENRGYSNGNIDFFKVAEYARVVGGRNIQFMGRTDGANDAAVERLTCEYGPQIVPVWGSAHPPGSPRTGNPRGHFVVTTGRDEPRTTFLISDPAGGVKRTFEGEDYANAYGGYRQFRGPEFQVVDELNGLVFFVHSPAELLVTDPAGRRTGFDAVAGRSYSEIPGASYGANRIDDLTDGSPTASSGTNEFVKTTPMDGDYTVSVMGTGTGTYDLDLRAYSGHGDLSQARYDDVAIEPGQVHGFQFSYAGAGMPEEPEVGGAFTGRGGRRDVDEFTSNSNPTARQTTLPAGTTSFALMIFYGAAIDPDTFTAELGRTDVGHLFSPEPGGMEVVRLPLETGRNVLVLSVEGTVDSRTARDRDRLTFVVP